MILDDVVWGYSVTFGPFHQFLKRKNLLGVVMEIKMWVVMDLSISFKKKKLFGVVMDLSISF